MVANAQQDVDAEKAKGTILEAIIETVSQSRVALKDFTGHLEPVLNDSAGVSSNDGDAILHESKPATASVLATAVTAAAVELAASKSVITID